MGTRIPHNKIFINNEILIQKIKEKLSLRELATYFGVSKDTIRRILKEDNIERNPNKPKEVSLDDIFYFG